MKGDMQMFAYGYWTAGCLQEVKYWVLVFSQAARSAAMVKMMLIHF